MRTFPTTVKEAAKVLDEVKPGWAKLIDLTKLSLTSTSSCPLGQLYGNYYKGLKDIFNLTFRQVDDLLGNEKEIKNPYGHSENGPAWIEEIQKRKETVVEHNWNWARLRLQEGKKITKSGWDNDYLLLSGNAIYTNFGRPYVFTASIFDWTDWELYEDKVCLKDLKRGDKFKFKKDWRIFRNDIVYQRISQPAHYQQLAFINTVTGELCAPFDGDIQEVVCLSN